MNRNIKLGVLLLFVVLAGFWIAQDSPITTEQEGLSALSGADEGAVPDVDSSPLADATPVPTAGDGRESVKDNSLAAKRAERKEQKRKDKEAARAKGPFLTGRILSDAGVPIADVEVTIKGQAQAGLIKVSAFTEETRSDTRGEFKIPRGLWPDFPVNVSLDAHGYALFESEARPEKATGDSTLGEFTLQSAVVLGGLVLDQGGQPIVGATVWRTEPDEDSNAMPEIMMMASKQGRYGKGSSETDEEGRFELAHEEPGEYAIQVTHVDHPQAKFLGTSPPAGTADLRLIINMEPGAVISGRIQDMPARNGGATVQAVPLKDEEESKTASFMAMFSGSGDSRYKVKPAVDGSFTLRGLPVGEQYKIQAWHSQGIMNKVHCSDEATAMAGATDVELTWESGASVVFDLIDAGTGKPIDSGTARYRWTTSTTSIMGNARRMLKFENNHVVISELRPGDSTGNMELIVFSEGYLAEAVDSIEIKEFERIELGTIQLNPCPKFKVQVLDGESGKPIKRARVVLYPNSDDDEQDIFSLGGKPATGKTDKQGWCELDVRSTELGTLSIRRRGYAPFKLEDIPMSKTADQSEVVRMLEGAKVVVQVTDAHGQPARDIKIIHEGPDSETGERESDGKGRVAYKDLPPGEHSFRAKPTTDSPFNGRRRRNNDGDSEEDELDWSIVSLTPGAEAHVEVQLPATTLLTGRVTRRGNPVSHAKITFSDAEEATEEGEREAELSERFSKFGGQFKMGTTTDAKGRFTLNDLPKGKHSIRVKIKGGAPAHYEPIDLFQDTSHVDIELPSSAVEGLVVDSKGGAIKGARLTIQRVEEDEERSDTYRLSADLGMFGGEVQGGSKTAADGGFLIEGIPEDRLLAIEVVAAGYVKIASSSFTSKADESVRCEKITMQEAGSLKVLVGEQEKMFEIVNASRTDKESPGPTSASAFGRDGKAHFKGLTPGEWTIKSQDRSAIVEIIAGEQTVLTLSE